MEFFSKANAHLHALILINKNGYAAVLFVKRYMLKQQVKSAVKKTVNYSMS